MYNPNTYGWYQCDDEDYDSGTPPDEQLATEPMTYDDVTGGAYFSDQGDYDGSVPADLD